jgi:ribonuclease-3
VVAEKGPDHSKYFEVVAVVGKRTCGRGTGRSKKEAEQVAAEQALRLLVGEPISVGDEQCQNADG